MDKHIYELCDSEGYAVLAIESGFTSLGYDAYCDKHIVPLLPILSANHGERVYISVGEQQ